MSLANDILEKRKVQEGVDTIPRKAQVLGTVSSQQEAEKMLGKMFVSKMKLTSKPDDIILVYKGDKLTAYYHTKTKGLAVDFTELI